MENEHLGSALLEAVAAGDEKAFTEVFHFYRKKVYSFAYRLTGSDALSEEILLDVFLKVWLKKEELPQVKNFQAWLFTITRNRVFSTLKQLALRKDAESILENNNFLQETTPYNFLQEKEYQRVLQEALSRLSPQQKKVYMLIKEYGLKREEAAIRLKLSPETVKRHLSEAMYIIRTYCLTHLGTYCTFLIIKELYAALF